jgi:4-diphosphocytidyl-2-C-methyl-D-erythritol kinase
VRNDFEVSAFKKHPELSKMKANLYADGAIYASMTGSGSVIYGVLRK